MPLEVIVEWGITLFIFAVIALACVQAVWPVTKVQTKYELERFPEPARSQTLLEAVTYLKALLDLRTEWNQHNLRMEDTMNLNATYQKIEDLLAVELQTAVATESISTRQARRTEIGNEIANLSREITTLNNRFRMLPELPPVHLIDWARAVTSLPNLAFLVLDTTGVDDDSDIIRVYAADWTGQKLFDCLVKPGRYYHANTFYTGITQEQIDAAPTLTEVWTFVQAALTGRYVLSYNLQFVRSRLTENATHYGLPGFALIGECLQEKARSYWGEYYPPKLVKLCQRIGHTLPTPATAPDRVAGQLALLKAMAAGITDVAVPVGVGAAVEDYLPDDAF